MILNNIKVYWASVLALALASLACTQVAVGGPTPEYPPIPVSTETVGGLVDKFSSLGAATGEVTVSITEAELTSLVAQKNAENPDSVFSNPQIYLRDGKIKAYMLVTTEQFNANALIIMTATVQNDQMAIGIESANFGPVPAPSGILDSLTSTVNDNLLSLVNKLPAGVKIKNIVIADGTLTLTAFLGN